MFIEYPDDNIPKLPLLDCIVFLSSIAESFDVCVENNIPVLKLLKCQNSLLFSNLPTNCICDLPYSDAGFNNLNLVIPSQFSLPAISRV